MGIYKNIDQEQRKQLLVIGAVLLSAVFVLVMIISLILHNRDSRQISTGGDSRTVQAKATIVGGNSLYSVLHSDARYTALGHDLADVYRNYFKSKTLNPTFTIQKSKAPLQFTGSFDPPSKKKIEITIETLPNERMKITAHDTSNMKDISNYFNSNSSLNQAIATLPIIADNYRVDYSVISNAFTESLFDRNPDLITQANAALMKKLGTKDLKGVVVHYIFPSAVDDSDIPVPAPVGE